MGQDPKWFMIQLEVGHGLTMHRTLSTPELVILEFSECAVEVPQTQIVFWVPRLKTVRTPAVEYRHFSVAPSSAQSKSCHSKEQNKKNTNTFKATINILFVQTKDMFKYSAWFNSKTFHMLHNNSRTL